MPNVLPIADADQRREALDPSRSFIVQAPAGSGKTSLLTQRYLTLLARVESPEEIVAITFTRKAAAEMRNRILEALHEARDAPPPDAAYERTTWNLARAVLACNERLEWDVLSHPARLRIQTIDSLCNSLTRQMPVLSRFGAVPATTTDAADLYRDAARATLALLETGEQWSPAVERLLRHLDNDLALVEGLLANMLARRDQWLRHVVKDSDREQQRASLEAAFKSVIEEALAATARALPADAGGKMVELARFAASNLDDGSTSDLLFCCDMDTLPGSTTEDLKTWCGIATLLLTNDGGWRKTATKNIGFPAPSSTKDAGEKAHYQAMKEHFLALLGDLAKEDDAFRVHLDALRSLPPEYYTEDQWQVMQALFDLLPVAVAQLKMVFREQGQVDFSEVAQCALEALGEPDNPTDLALALDYRMQHILVDEFQDTSFGQYQLLERLTAGWQHDDGRTLFVVGDPMQSIYRFREAEVGLFLRARQQGVGSIRLTPLTLSVNFRSQAGIVEWVNQSFAQVFPVTEDISSGAVAYSPSQASHEMGEHPAVEVHPFFINDANAEAFKVVDLVQQARRTNPKGTVAILVRARSHLAQIAPALQTAGLRYRAIEIERLGHRPVIQDLLALTRALLHPADRIAWLAILRAPWCGLTLADLHALAAGDHHAALWDLMQNPAIIDLLSADGKCRLERVRNVLQTAFAQRQRRTLRLWTEGVWLALGGPACVQAGTDLEDALVFFELLENMHTEGNPSGFMRIEERVEKLFALPDMEADESLQLMTIHKAKGLEFDTVIVPALGRRMPSDESRLLMWMERPALAREEGDLLLAPIKGNGQKDDPIYTYIKSMDQQKGVYEAGRLLYVAATRAREKLHLLGHTTLSEKDGAAKKPQSSSLLNQLWAVVEKKFAINTGGAQATGDTAPTAPIPGLRRLKSGWRLPDAPASVAISSIVSRPTPSNSAENIEFLWASDTARHVGTVVHRILRKIAQQGADFWSGEFIAAQRPRYRTLLAQSGVPLRELDEAAQRVEIALARTLEDERGRWLLDHLHHDAQCEYALTGIVDGKPVNVIIDRTFVDQQGVRWIIDYKTGGHEGTDTDAFLDSEQTRYRPQLQRYAELMSKLDDKHAIRLGLYFPLLGGWREWSYHAS